MLLVVLYSLYYGHTSDTEAGELEFLQKWPLWSNLCSSVVISNQCVFSTTISDTIVQHSALFDEHNSAFSVFTIRYSANHNPVFNRFQIKRKVDVTFYLHTIIRNVKPLLMQLVLKCFIMCLFFQSILIINPVRIVRGCKLNSIMRS